ncbi:MAG: thiamine phosphate synthase [Bryobacteraceae bacterium]
MRRYYITDSRAAGGTDAVLTHIQSAIASGVDYIQIREKDLSARAFADLVRVAVRLAGSGPAKILVNERTDVALAAGAHGVHLPSESLSPTLIRPLLPDGSVIAVSCHTLSDVERAEAEGADFVVLGPVFETPGKGRPLGLEAFGQIAKSAGVPVFALGGITVENAGACIRAGAAGVAAIRMFQQP